MPRYLVAATDPLVHALLAAAVAAPLGTGAVRTAVAAGTLIDVDHAVAARSLRMGPMLSLPARPRSHTLALALVLGAVGAAAGGPRHGWAAFAGLGSHLLRDASGEGAPTPLLWPVAAPPRISVRVAIAGCALLALGSWAISRRGAAS